MKIAACVILYNPEDAVEKNIYSYIHHVEKVYVIDNSEHKNYASQFLSAYISKVRFIHDGNNEGIAKRLNQACTLAVQDKFEYLLTMDQDSCFEQSTVERYLTCIGEYIEKESTSMFGINHEQNLQKADCVFSKTSSLITSGSIINLAAYKDIGSFDENLFIDFVDTEYCFRSILKGYDVVLFPNIFMHHEIGKTTRHRSLKNLKSSKRSIHSAARLYYMIRNHFYLSKKYKDHFAQQLSISKKDILNRIKNKLFYDSDRIQTIRYLLKAFNDYRNNRMGKLL
ncbi:MAG TPA: glycosyltransferase family 2 protein [Parafilimonas sp.]|nr:glycosyltransferase family 2 protein [Parafilimonas sp.]